ncbi:MAG: LysR family transcriptional regulator [Salinicola sp.]|uniref:LysR family transcriptional regulator n=1 Tax=uncultured Salinicola sp. TaxID=1193542 RepID=UPI000C8F44B5|nr:LysR family transcriptional regulator [uncultured Salinicola sp.]MAM58549.1 LysR family transcriptional regulator [Salinicola sp.]
MIVELKTLVAVAECGTFAEAGRRLGLTQAAVSGHMRRLETHLGYPLFDRTGRSASLNADGMRTLARAQTLLADFASLGDRDETGEVGFRRIGAIASMQSTVVTRALVPFQARYPRYRVHIVGGLSLQLLDGLDRRELDLCVMIRPALALPEEFVFEPLVSEPYRLLVAAAEIAEQKIPSVRSWLANRSLIRYERGSFGGRQLDQFLRSRQLPLQETIEVDDIAAMIAMVRHRLGVALVPMTESMLPLPDDICALPLAEAAPAREIGIIRRQKAVSPVTDYLVTCLIGAVDV